MKKIIFAVLAVALVGGAGAFIYVKWQDSLAQRTVATFTNGLKKKQFETYEGLFSNTSLKKADITEKEVITKYDKIFNGLGMSDITISDLSVEKKDSKRVFRFTAAMDTGLGKISDQSYEGTLVKEDGKFVIDWEYRLIFPGMKQNDKVLMYTEKPERGNILDRNGVKLATNGDFPQIGLVPKELGSGKEREDNLKKISDVTEISMEKLTEALEQSWVTDDSFVPLKILERNEGTGPYTDLQGVTSSRVSRRFYQFGEAASHLVGYTGAITAEDIEKSPELASFETTGKTGLERSFDKQLRGTPGGTINIVSETDEVRKVLVSSDKQDGQDIRTTLDAALQQEAYNSLAEETGAMVITQAKTGELLAVASAPAFDPNSMVKGMSEADYNKLAEDKRKPFLSRYNLGYAPGSTFKTITAAVGIDAGVTSPDKERHIEGLKWQKDASWGDYFVTRVSDVPTVTMNTALIYSDNIYFAQEALEIGAETYLKGLKKFIFDEKLAVKIPMEPAQISNDTIDSDILLADTAYGQGQLLINPIQQAAMYSVFANNGDLSYPSLLTDDENKVKKGVITPAAANSVKQAMRQVVDDPNGTAHNLQRLGINLAAKTGTAEIKTEQDTKGQENSFLVAFDADNSEFLVLTLIENYSGTSASEISAPVLSKLKQ